MRQNVSASRVATAGPGDLRAGSTSFLGRRDELRELVRLARACRLLCLVGPPGIGKSRLGVELVGQVRSDHPDGTRMVELAALRDGALPHSALASALSVQELPGVDLLDAIMGNLGGRRLLLVLDNCEHLRESCGQLVTALLEGCPELRILATSREPLGLHGERVWQVPPLPVPDPTDEDRAEVVGLSPAVCLFVERARVVEPRFELNAHVAGSVAEICRRLDGIPLAIELAAARADLLTPAEIARRLDDRFRLLTGGGPSGAPRHQTLEAALDWSHALLSVGERALLRRLSVFAGGFDLEGVHAVCGATEAPDVLDGFAGLVSKSLVAIDTSRFPVVRYRMLETVRAYAAERLEEAREAPWVREHHARYYLGLAEDAEPELEGPGQERWFERLEAERANLGAAFEWSVGHGRGEWALRMAGALVLLWRVRCRFSEGRDLLRAALSASDGAAVRLRAKALWGMGFLALMAGDTAGAAAPLEESLARYRELEDLQGCARALLILGNCRQFTDPQTVLTLLDESEAMARTAGDLWCLSHALGVKGFDHAARDDLPTARGLFEECLRVARCAQDKQGLRMGLLGLGAVALQQGDYRVAESALDEALAITGELGDAYASATALQYRGQLALAQGEHARARELLTAGLGLVPRFQCSYPVVPTLTHLATAARAQGDRCAARRLYENALAAVPGHRHPPALHGMAELAAEEGDPNRARRLLEEALDVSRRDDDRSATAQVLRGLGELARAEGDLKRSTVLHTEALELSYQIGRTPDVVASLESMGALAALSGRYEQAVRTFGATQALRDAGGYARAPWKSAGFERDVTAARDALGTDNFRTALTEGAALSLAEAVNPFRRVRGRRDRPSTGWPSLTDGERRVADLIADGLTNPEIAQRLFISLSTVKTHLSHIFSKLGVTGRKDLAREVRIRRFPPCPPSPVDAAGEL